MFALLGAGAAALYIQQSPRGYTATSVVAIAANNPLSIGDEPGDPDARRLLYVHGLYFDDADGLRADIHDMERRMLHALRRTGVAA